ncbi:Uncharacterized conserved protein YdhG, YjbR/CyaY-like superfamily, DUF1801 family [Dethiosulfatibacter aminovorans DSM 17477]|uniref:Uncharacterized conserved protein YdhG, YjbR/CyaY-like superfamily, DUF1801 family n=1 Tax=Dethiosulfatibacter aminovorans DSM 17477 TaxID=1121476 RepID=A0A1M6MDE8_9FIRM|nr:DUF1801 domain-containing protein [Dethiosulfatibacter aminovorans]SHJ81492.1 Uncharacterized conserved protein YdhG, YjbR/CyaY-like superfamily, DUF1801 family [Dethiosulfatibacter aminovorans DSM 17477]
MSGKYKNVEEYLNDQPEHARALLLEMKSLILEVVPEAEEVMNYGVPAYALVEGGKAEQQVMIAGFKKHVGLYPHPETIEHFAKELKGYKTSTGTVQFPLDKPLPAKLIKDMVAYRRDMISEER